MSTFDQSRVIGRVSSVNSELITIELDPLTPGYVKGGLSGIMPVGSINSYVTMTAGMSKIVAVVTSIKVLEGPPESDSKFAAATIRILEAAMIGRIESGVYRPGITTYPALFTPVSGATAPEIAQIFKSRGTAGIRFGEAVVQPGQDVILDGEALLSKHCAIVGSTGAGKSCSVMALLDGLLSLALPSANIVIFDTNGEYAKAFNSDRRTGLAVPLVIGGTDQQHVDLHLPHWFMDNLEHLGLFRASEGIQGPVLLRSVADARLGSEEQERHVASALLILRQMDHYEAVRKAGGRKPQETLLRALTSLHENASSFRAQHDEQTDEHRFWDEIVTITGRYTQLGLDANLWDQPPSLQQNQAVNGMFADVRSVSARLLEEVGLSIADVASDFDAPRYYSLEQLIRYYLPRRIDIESLTDPKFRSYMSGMLLRIGKLLADSRYNFFTRVPRFDDALALFLRLLLGWYPNAVAGNAPWRERYVQVHGDSQAKHRVIIIDLSSVGSDVLEHVTSLIARLIIDFCQRLTDRASIPVLLVLEEAHRYVPPIASGGNRGAEVFERIAKEGRKFGVSIFLASQRPSELSPTVLAQCGTLIAHRIVSEEDQNIIRHATPFASREVLRQLPGLATQHAVVIGDAVPAPTYVRVRDVPDRPRSEDPPYLEKWSQQPTNEVSEVIDTTARMWEQSSGPARQPQEQSFADEPEDESDVPF